MVGPDGRTEEGSASPGSAATDDITPTPPSPCLHDLGDDDATPRQQWSPVHTLVRASSHPNAGYCSTFAGVRGGGGADNARVRGTGTFGAYPAGLAGSNSDRQSSRSARPDSPVMRVDDLERLDLSVLALGEEHSSAGAEAEHPDTFNSLSGAGQIGPGGRPRSLGGRPSRAPALFVAPGHLGAGPSSPPSSYSTHSESGFTSSPTRRVASPSLPREQGRVRKGHWKKGKPIGVGSCGNVYLGMNDDTGELMAVKEITLEAKERLLCSLYNEIQVMHKLVHPHIVGYLGAELQDSQRKLCIFQEWVPAGSLHSLLDQFGALSDAMTRKYTGQVLEGLAYLHANRVIHRDVKSKNILVDDRGSVKLADFGCALVLKDDNHGDGVEMSMKGTPLFMAPEMLLKRKCGRRVDVWSLGCAVLEMVTTRPPWADAFKHPVEIIAHFSENPGPPPLPDNLSPCLRHFLLSCFTWDAERRPSAQELCAHQYLQARAGPPAADGSPGEDMPLEEMDRVSAVTRMRRCSSATLDLLAVQARQVALGVSIGALAAFGTAPSGTFRPPSPRYAPGGLAAHNKRTPTRRRMYGPVGVSEMGPPQPPDSVAPAVTSAVKSGGATGGGANSEGQGSSAAGADMKRTSSMPGTGSPPISPDKPRRPGRGYSGSSGSGTSEEEGRHSGPILPARLRSLGAVDRSGSSRSFGSGDTTGGRHAESAGLGSRESGSAGGAGGGGGAGASAVSPAASARCKFVTPATPATMPPLVREGLGVTLEGGRGAPGVDLGPASDTPPPTVRPLELPRTVWPGIAQEVAANALLHQRKGVRGAKGMWGKVSVISDARGGTGSRH